MHIFLTGARQAGKSTAVHKALALLPFAPGGFYTRFESAPRLSGLYMLPYGAPPAFDEHHLVAKTIDGHMTALDNFERLGTALLDAARQSADGVIVMDELGHVEKNAVLFHQAIGRCLDGGKPILGVLRQDQGWHDFIRRHPKAQIIEVTENNRDGLPAYIASALRAGV